MASSAVVAGAVGTGNSGAADVGVVVAVSIIGVDYVGNGDVALL